VAVDSIDELVLDLDLHVLWFEPMSR